MPNFEAIKNTPDISFIDGKTIEDVQTAMTSDFETFMTAAEGREFRLERTSVFRMIINAVAVQLYQAMQYVDRAGKQNLLKYSYSEFLDNLALFKGVTRLPAAAAVTTLRFTLAAALDSATAIPQGTRASTPENIYFATDDYAEIPAGSTYIDVPATCTETGAAANGIPIGEIQVLVDPIPYIESVSNIVASGGGADTESDEDLAERVYLAPSAYSTAGPEDSYIYHTKEYNPAIGDVVVTSDQAAGEVDVYFLMDDGSTPDATTISGLQAHLNDKTIRPMTDVVVVDAPAAENYTINLTYYINQSDSSQAVTIQSDVNQAITDYIQWQRHIGRDINPSKLISMIMAAGAKRVVVTYPVYTVVASTKVPTLSSDPTITYGGLEND